MLPKAFLDTVLSVHIPEKEREVIGNYVNKTYGGEDMVEYFSLLLLERMRSEPSKRLREQVQEIEMRLVERNLFKTFRKRNVKTDFVEMMKLGFVDREKEKGLKMVDNNLGRAAFMDMKEGLQKCSSEDEFLICREFVNTWSWGGEIKS
jgi:hypothetical protein